MTLSAKSAPFEIEGRLIDKKQAPYLVAELSGNHKQNLGIAKSLVRAAARAGADAVKLQTYSADTLTLPGNSSSFCIEEGLWKGRRLYDLYGEAMTPWEWHRPLAELAADLGLTLFSTPFDETAVAFLEEQIDPPVYKIASFEITHIPLLKVVGQTGKPVIMSTGMAAWQEIETAVDTLLDAGSPGVMLLKCISSYPANPEDFNLRSLRTLEKKFNCPVGLSDHTMGSEIVVGAVALGACLIEKHLTLDRNNGAIDNGFSLEPDEFAEMSRAAGHIHRALGCGKIEISSQEIGQKKFRRSIFASAPIKQGEKFGRANLKIIRPSDGLPPANWERVLNTRANCDIPAGSPLREEHVNSTTDRSEAKNFPSHT